MKFDASGPALLIRLQRDSIQVRECNRGIHKTSVIHNHHPVVYSLLVCSLYLQAPPQVSLCILIPVPPSTGSISTGLTENSSENNSSTSGSSASDTTNEPSSRRASPDTGSTSTSSSHTTSLELNEMVKSFK